MAGKTWIDLDGSSKTMLAGEYVLTPSAPGGAKRTE